MVICAAIKFRFTETGRETVICGKRHGDVYSMLEDMGFKPKSGYVELEQGFMCTDGFRNRKDALNHAIICGQLSRSTVWYKQDHGDDELYSEDLY